MSPKWCCNGLRWARACTRLNPLCRLCRMIFQQVCAAETAGGDWQLTRPAEFEHAGLLKDVRSVRTA